MEFFNQFCAICAEKFHTTKRSIHVSNDLFPGNPLKIYEFLEIVSNFEHHEDDPRSLCASCLINARDSYDFYNLCNKSQIFFENYMKHHLSSNKLPSISATPPIPESPTTPKVAEIEQPIIENIQNESSNDSFQDNFQDEDLIARKAEVLELRRARYREDKTQCEICHKWKSTLYMKEHMRVHSGDRPYKCKYCDFTFNHPSALRLHTRIHEQKYDYVCKFCGKMFINLAGFKVHEARHAGIKPFKCDVCPKAFVTRSHLNKHLKVHSGKKPYKCKMCDRCFTQGTQLNVHVKKVHEGIRNHVCHLCGKKYYELPELRKHLKSHPIMEDGIIAPAQEQNQKENEEFYQNQADSTSQDGGCEMSGDLSGQDGGQCDSLRVKHVVIENVYNVQVVEAVQNLETYLGYNS